MLKHYTSVALLALVAGCGGGTTPVATGESAAPPSAVTPTPAPVTPTPPPAPVSYISFDDIYSTRMGSSGVSVQSACAGFVTAATPPAPFTPLAFGRGLVFRYVQTPNVWSISGDVGAGFDGRDSDPFAAALTDPSAAGTVEFAYSKTIGPAPGRFTIRKQAPGGTGLNYTRLASVWATVGGTARLYQCVPGIPTAASELAAVPVSAFARTAIVATAYLRDPSARAFVLAGSIVGVTADMTARRVTVSLQLTGTPADSVGGTVDFGLLSASLPLDPATGAFAGDLTGTGRDVSGTVSGQLFGPNGSEIGLVFGATIGAGGSTPGFTAAGAVFGGR